MKINNLKKKCFFLSDFDLFVVVKIVKSSNNSPELLESILNEKMMKINNS